MKLKVIPERMTKERIAQLRKEYPRRDTRGCADINECLDEIERLQAEADQALAEMRKPG